MKLPFKDQAAKTARIAKALCQVGSKRGINLVSPPGFQEEEVAEEVVSHLREAFPENEYLIAKLAFDRPRDGNDYVDSLHAQWSKSFRLPPLPDSADPCVRLESLLSSLPDDRPVIQVVTRFHTVLGEHLGTWVLGTLREYERQGKLQSFVISYLPYAELKRRWVSHGHSLIVSNYGENHDLYEIEPIEIEEASQLDSQRRISPGILRFMAELTGLYPEVFEATFREWDGRGRLDLSREVKQELSIKAEKVCFRLIQWLDPASTSIYRDYVANMHLGIETEDALEALCSHPWSKVLLDADKKALRAECVGSAALRQAMDEAIWRKCVSPSWENISNQALRLYKHRRFREAAQLLSNVSKPGLRDRILLRHAVVMECLSVPGLDVDWERLRRSIRLARETLSKETGAIEDTSQLEGRYVELEDLANTILSSLKNGPKIVDTLAGLGTFAGNPESAVLLILLWSENCRAIHGNSMALYACQALPEQVFRLWAFLCMKVDYYHAPEGEESKNAWEKAGAAWPRNHGELKPSAPGTEFESFRAFAYFILAAASLMGLDPSILPEPDFQSLDQTLSLHAAIRNPSAHALSLVNRKSRDKFFAIIERWVCALLRCPALDGISRQTLLNRIEPLPVVENDGTIDWSAG